MQKFKIIFIILILNQSWAKAQVDSIDVILKNEKTDSGKVNLLIDFAQQYSSNDALKAKLYANEALKISKKSNYTIGLAKSYRAIGIIDYKRGDYSNALFNYFQSLKLYEQLGSLKGRAAMLNNIGLLYGSKFENEKAIYYHQQSLLIKQQLKDSLGISATFNNLGMVYTSKNNLDSALYFNEQSLNLRERLADTIGIGTSLYNIANIYFDINQKEKALDYHLKALDIFIKTNQVYNICYLYTEISVDYSALKDFYNAKKYADLANKNSTEFQIKEAIMESYRAYFILYQMLNDADKELFYYKKYIALKDEINSDNNVAKIAKLETEYEFQKKLDEQKEEQIRNELLQEAESKRQKTIILLGSFVLLLVATFSYFLYTRLKLIRVQKTQIENQKHIVEEKQKEIVDSITYAKRLQQAILPPNNLIQKYLPNSFILYKPKDIVAGDFYWLEHKNDLVMIAAADCTGHGVPGAMVSVVCSNALNRTVKEFGLTESGKILDKVRELVIETFEKSESEVKDGMDISLCVIDFKNKKMQWSGANNPLWIVRREIVDNRYKKNEQSSQYSNLNTNILIEYKANKQPIGKYSDPKPFTTNEIDLQLGDNIYIFTDGYADQFGGEKGKKYTYKRLREKLLSISNKPENEQNELLDKDFEIWKGLGEQIDDVCLIGIKI